MIAIAAGKRRATVIALNRYTGKDVWCALPSDNSEPRYFQPILIHHGRAQLVVWHVTALESVDPETGALLRLRPSVSR